MKKPEDRDNGIPKFDREFFTSDKDFSFIGQGSLGGKASGLINISQVMAERYNPDEFPGISLSIPRMTVLRTNLFDSFMETNKLYDLAMSEDSDVRLAHAFQQADLPATIAGDLYALISGVHTPLAVRSSSLLEDAMYEPFAGIYATKMTANNQFDKESRFRKLIEAIKFVYSSVYFKQAKDYFKATRHQLQDEKMAVIIQEVVGRRHNKRYYPDISGVARSYNFYTSGHARPEDGVVNLALGLGRIIVDEGIAWSYSPSYPRANPPYNSIDELMKQTQTHFWSVNMGELPFYDPAKETEYLVKLDLNEAQKDKTLKFLASSYDRQSDRIYPGPSSTGPNILNFAPLLVMNQIPLNDLIIKLLKICEEAVNAPVEIEFALTLDPDKGGPARFGFLQVRPMVVSHEEVNISPEELTSELAIVSSESVLGNGIVNYLHDIIFVKPEKFEAKYTRQIAAEVEQLNEAIKKSDRKYILIGFGRWGSADPWLGIPVDWGQISGAKIIVECTLPEMNVDLSQGSHFFHNLSSFQISYFSVKHTRKYQIDWDWLKKQETIGETEFVKHIKLPEPVKVKVDGRTGRGVIHR